MRIETALLFPGVFHLAVPVESLSKLFGVVMEINGGEPRIGAQGAYPVVDIGLRLQSFIFLMHAMKITPGHERSQDQRHPLGFLADFVGEDHGILSVDHREGFF